MARLVKLLYCKNAGCASKTSTESLLCDGNERKNDFNTNFTYFIRAFIKDFPYFISSSAFHLPNNVILKNDCIKSFTL